MTNLLDYRTCIIYIHFSLYTHQIIYIYIFIININYVLCSSTYDCTMYTLSLLELLTSSSIACFGESDMALPQCPGGAPIEPRLSEQIPSSEKGIKGQCSSHWLCILNTFESFWILNTIEFSLHDLSWFILLPFCRETLWLQQAFASFKSCAKIDTHSTVTSCITKLQSVATRAAFWVPQLTLKALPLRHLVFSDLAWSMMAGWCFRSMTKISPLLLMC